MSFKQAVAAAPAQVARAYKPGKQALRDVYSGKILTEGGTFTGSIDLDSALVESHGQESRWDYGLGYKIHGVEVAVWLEVHPASDGEVKAMIRKLNWLRTWLRDHAPHLNALTGTDVRSTFFWAAKNGVTITPHSPQARSLSNSGMAMPRNVITLP